MKEKRTCYIMDFAVSVDLRVKIKEREKRSKYLDQARELKQPWNIKGDHIYPTPPLWQDVTQGQFFSGV